MNQGIIGIIIALLVILAGVVYWMNSSDTPTVTSSSPAVSETLPATSSPTNNEQMSGSSSMNSSVSSSSISTSTEAIKTITVKAKNYSFSPSSITVKKGEKIAIVLTSSQGAHDIKIDALGVASKTVNTGETTSVEFTPTKAGTYEYYCGLSNHRAMGMIGTLIVE